MHMGVRMFFDDNGYQLRTSDVAFKEPFSSYLYSRKTGTNEKSF